MNASVHWRTPIVAVNDPRGRIIRQVACLRKVLDGPVQSLISRQYFDLAGRLATQRDPRLGIPNTSYIHGLNGAPLKIHNVDAGVSVILPGQAGELAQAWDAHDNHRSMTYDDQLRMVAVKENATPDVETCVYADASADAGHNRRGQMVEINDPSGRVERHSFALTGPMQRETRTFHDGLAFSSQQSFTALGARLQHVDAGGHRQQLTYDVAGQLIQVQLQLNGQPEWRPVLERAQFDAEARIIEQRAGNGVISRWHYRTADGRLLRHCTQKASGPVLQDFGYEYDRMGNITVIVDHIFTPVRFANQRVDGHRTFAYDSLYRLRRATGYSDAPPADNSGRPQPSNPVGRRNYIETYEHDDGDNLIKTTHMRDSVNHTFECYIDPLSNRGMRWKPGEPPPDFTTLFDRAGNLRALQPGQPMRWNSRNQLESVTLLARNGSSPDDEEHYRYSQGERVYKRHDSHTANAEHFHEARYLPELEIRTRDKGEELHLISVSINTGRVVCLHWVSGKPTGLAQDQLRYSLGDYLRSVSMELDQQARLISHEGYLPFGTTAWMAARTLLEVDYRFIRYSGKEMDVGGLYYYGARYFAPWLGRWISADPAGDVDGPNLYAFVGNNPIFYVDDTGNGKTEAGDTGNGKTVGYKTGRFFGAVKTAKTATAQMKNIASDFDKLIPEDANIETVRKDLTFGKYITSKYGRSAIRKGAGVGGTAGAVLSGIVAPLFAPASPAIAAAGPVIGMIVVPWVGYGLLKKGLKRADILQRAEAINDVIDTADEILGVIDAIPDHLDPEADEGADTKKPPKAGSDTYKQNLEKLFFERMKTLPLEQQVAIGELMQDNVPAFKAMSQVLKAAGATPSSTQPTQEVSASPQEKPIPKPRANMSHTLRRSFSGSYT